MPDKTAAQRDAEWWEEDVTVVTPFPGEAVDKTVQMPMAGDRTVRMPISNDAPGAGDETVVTTIPEAVAGTGSPGAAKPAAGYVPLPAGFRLHEYRVDKVLGQGGFGIAYAATDVNLNAKVVIKEYFPEDFAYRSVDNEVTARTSGDRSIYQSGLESFLVEARTLATFRHPHIVRVARFFEFHATAYMVLEYERGESLRTWRKTHQETGERELVELLAPLLDGLEVVHSTGFLHRDIKPDNIYVRDGDGTLVLLDFGAARHAAAAKAEDGANAVTPGYGPIEQFNELDNQGPWTDLYALGATLFWLVTGKRTIAAPDRMVETDPQPSAAFLCEGRYSPEFLKAIDWALKLEPQDRPQSVAEFRSALFASNVAALGLQEALRKGDAAAEAATGAEGLSLLKSPRLLARRIKDCGRALVQPRSWPIAVRTILAMVLAALLPMVITAHYNLQGTLASVSGSQLRNLEHFSQSTAGRIAQLLDDSGSLANYLGTDSDFVAFLGGVTDEGKESIRSKLAALVKANRDVQLAMVMDAGGTAVVSSDPQVMGKNFKFREYFKVAMEGRPHTTGITVGAVAGAAGMFYSYPVRSADGNVLGAVVLRIKADPIYRILSEAETGGRTPFLVDGHRIIVAHSDPKVLYSSLVPLEQKVIDEIVADQRFRRKKIETVNETVLAHALAKGRERGNVSYTSGMTGRAEIAGYAEVPGQDWMVVVSQSSDAFAAPLNQLFYNVLMSVAIVGVVFLIFAVLFARSIVKPIRELERGVHALKSGDYDAAHIPVRSNDEVGRLARTFNVMIDVLRQRERERAGRRKGAAERDR